MPTNTGVAASPGVTRTRTSPITRAGIELSAPGDAATPVFVGIGPAAEVDAYLSGVACTVPDASGQGQDIAGSPPPAPPQAVEVWQAQSAGPGAASLDVGVAAPWLPWLGGLFIAAGVVVMVVAIVLVVVAVQRASR